jgi:hypothetical protein
MKTLRKICTTAILALALGVPVYAGQIETPGYTGPPPPPPPPDELNITLELGDPTAPSFDLGDTSSPSFADLLWALASIF